MMEKKINGCTIRLDKGDVTDIEVEAFVYYAQHDLKLGTGFGGAIAVRGGPEIQQELDKTGPIKTTEAVVSSAGNMKAKQIIHAVGPRFQEEQEETKLRLTMRSVFDIAEKHNIDQVAFPPMGTGFYGIPLELSARVMLETITERLQNTSKPKEVIICLADKREFSPFQTRFATLA